MNFRQVRKKIKAIQNVKKITKAMQMVAAVKMKKAQKSALEGKLYREILDKILSKVLTSTDPSYSILLKSDQKELPNKNLYVFISSNKGLCGSFNFNLFKLAFSEINFEKDDFIILGKKGSNFILKMRGKVLADFSDQIPFIDNVSAIFSIISDNFINNKYRAMYLFYNKFISTFRFDPTKIQLLPVVKIQDMIIKGSVQEKFLTEPEYLIEPSPHEIIGALVQDFLKEKIRQAILDSEAAEYSARMMAMKNATDNANDIIYNLTLLRNKLRQEGITNELLDMISAKQVTEES